MIALYIATGAAVAAIPAGLAAVAGVRRLIDWADRHTDHTGGGIWPRREPIAAITARPHWEASDALGPWNPSQHQQVPAHIHDQLIGAGQ